MLIFHTYSWNMQVVYINTEFPFKNAIKKNVLALFLILMKLRTALGRGSRYSMLLNWLQCYVSFKLHHTYIQDNNFNIT